MPQHIVRLIVLIVLFLVVAFSAKSYFTVDSFYRYGHFRGNSVAQIASKEPVYQTSAYCKTCHTERHAQWSASNHKTVQCEVCHTAAQGHPANGKLPIPKDTLKLCTLCHEQMTGRPSAQPQIDVEKHANNQQCVVCHNPHSPKIQAVAATVKGDAAAGRERAAMCAGCHGPSGMSPNDTWPNLAGQHPAYLARVLSAFKSGAQKDVAMTPMAQGLSDADVQNLATYFGGLACQAEPAGAKVGDAGAGRQLAKNCAVCHGETGQAPNPAWPKLAGQKPGYLINALKAFRAGLRKDPIMSGVAKSLADTDIANLAAFFSSQSCQATTLARKAP